MTTNKYYFQALDNFPYNLEETMQALNYALSYDPEDADSLCLMGRIYSEMLSDYENREEWNRMSLVNIAKAGYFSSDRTIRDYNQDIWKIDLN